jgi:tetratricopeptide (TPR) repeat protein
VANLRGAGARAQTLLFLLDAIQGFFASLEDAGLDLRAEGTRVEDVERLLLVKDAILVRQMQSGGGLAAAREALKPSPAQWWWFLDVRVAERRQQQIRRFLRIGGAIAAVLLIASLVYKYVFPPDPRQVAVMEKTSEAERALEQGDLALALSDYREAAEIMPEDPELHIWVGVLAEKQGDQTAADEAFAAAQALVENQAQFHAARGMTWFQVGDVDEAELDADAAVAADPEYAEAYLLLGNVYEARRDVPKAIEAFERTADLAGAQNNSALIVLAKTRLGMLLQSAPMMAPPDETPGPTPSS